MDIAIIGSGNVGAAIAKAAVGAGHSVILSAADPAHARAAAAEAGAAAAASNVEAVSGSDIVVLAVPGSVVGTVVDELAGVLAGAVVVDSTNPLNATYSDLDIEGVSGAEDLQRRLPGIPVVKAFNTVFASRHAQPIEGGSPLDAYLAGDDEAAKARVAQFAASLGYHPVDVGGLRLARALEEMALLNITLNARNGWVWQSGWRLVGPTQAA